ncbi:hypothetical protein ETAE_1817 [Edwardsiella piscicida]|uniref:Uncharacterized protein n=1 Tax=Edwardsiella piscicida TaxID=1263550 RepID=A0AAU8P7E9_EDWPI|nr:hypothetical protein ETAE_1817 [Edwardsiella tarda EIB202]
MISMNTANFTEMMGETTRAITARRPLISGCSAAYFTAII